MVAKRSGKFVVVKLVLGDRLSESISNCRELDNRVFYSVSAIGAVKWAKLAFYDLDSKEYKTKMFNQNLEITSLNGNLTWSSDLPVFHCHGNFADASYKTFGGHIVDFEVSGTCELIFAEIDKSIKREIDESTGLNLLKI